MKASSLAILAAIAACASVDAISPSAYRLASQGMPSLVEEKVGTSSSSSSSSSHRRRLYGADDGQRASRASLKATAASYERFIPSIEDIHIAADGYSLLSSAPHPHAQRRLQEQQLHAAASSSSSSSPTLNSVVSVYDFGANSSNPDNTAAFQSALNSLPTGGIVFVPSGVYNFSGTISIPTSVSLVGTFVSVASHPVGQGGIGPVNGSTLCPFAGRGNVNGTAFISMMQDTTIKGFTIYYPEQLATEYPSAYPWTISMVGNDIAVQDVELLNSYNGISAVGAHRHIIQRVIGQPTNIGIFIDQTYDIGRLQDVHWNPWFSDKAAYIAHQTVYGQGFLIARTDWEYVLNTFVFAMAVGYQFVESSTGACNGNFVGIGADCCANASVLVEDSDPWGISVVNGEFTSFSGGFGPDVADHTQVVVLGNNVGAVRFVNSAFWGPSNQIASINGTGSVGFSDCMFNTWDAKSLGRAAIQVWGGDSYVRGCDFQTSHPGGQVYLANGSGKSIITDNLIKGAMNVTNDGAKTAIIQNNAPDV